MTRRNRRPAVDHPDLMAVLGLGTPPVPELVDARPAREHVQRLHAAGWGSRSIAARTGLGRRTVRALTAGRTAGAPPTRQVLPDTARRILEIDPEEVPPCHRKAS
ncbi:hypothetical protein ACWFMI_24850 [Nocardiopsis terrae]